MKILFLSMILYTFESFALNGPCCVSKPDANPVYDCSQPLLNFGHPQGIAAAELRCKTVYQGRSCQWSTANPKCVIGDCKPPSVLLYNKSIANIPQFAQEFSRCKKEAGPNSNDNYKCCVDVKTICSQNGGTPTVGTSCGVGRVLFGPISTSGGPALCCD